MNRINIRLLALLLSLTLLAAGLPLNPVYAEETTTEEIVEEIITKEITESDHITLEDANGGTTEDTEPEAGRATTDIKTITGTIGNSTNIFVSVGYQLKITNLQGEVTASGDSTIATVTYSEAATGGSTLSITGVSEGTTTITISETVYTIYVVPFTNKNENSKTAKINVVKIENCDVYAVINGRFFEVTETGIFMDQTFAGPLSVVFFAAPKEGYALSRMDSTNSTKQFYTISDGDEYGVGSDAWPLSDPKLDTIPDSNSSLWKTGSDGFKNQLLEGHYTLASLKTLFNAALSKGCDGALAFAKRWQGNNLNTELTFIAEKMPEMKKHITQYQLSTEANTGNWHTYNANETPNLRIGAKLKYTFEITPSIVSENVDYTNVLLTDDQINFNILLKYDRPENETDEAFVYGYVGGKVKDTPDYRWDVTETKFTITAEYTINREDASKYSNSKFENHATLSYNYKSRYSFGSHANQSSSSIECHIYGIATYLWADALPDSIKNLDLPKSHEFVANDKAYVSDKTYDYVITNEGSTWAKWTFKGWNLKEDGNNEKFYQPGDEVIVTENNAVNATLIGYWDSESLAPHSVTYTWSGLPDHTTCENEHPEIPTDKNQYYETQSYTVDGYYEQGSIHKHGNDEYVFSGWILNGKVVSDAQIMGDSDVTLTGVWTNQNRLTDLLIEVSGCEESLDENQTFLFHVTGEGLDMTLTIHGNGNATISGLEVGKTYTVTQLTDWSWRYKTETAIKSITLTTGEDKVTFPQTRPNTKWLDGNAFWNILKPKEEGD